MIMWTGVGGGGGGGVAGNLYATNTQEDTALHSLMRFAYLYREKTHDVERMLLELHERLKTSTGAASPQVRQREV